MNDLTRKVADLALAGTRPPAIARELGIEIGSVYYRIKAARRGGIKVPKFNSHVPPQPRRWVRMTDAVRQQLEPVAGVRGMDVIDLAETILKVVAEDDLVDAVLDDWSGDD